MRKAHLVLTATAALYARMLFAQPTPTPTPPVHDGPTLEITFSGMALFVKMPQGYQVIVPAMRAHDHEAYIRFPVKDANANTFQTSEPFKCERVNYQWSPLTADRLTIEPASAIENTPFNATAIDDWLAHLKRLAPAFELNQHDYNQADPIVGKVSAQMTVDNGTFKPLELQPPHHSVRWEFKDGSQSSNEKVCGTSGIRWLVPIKKDTRTISIVSSLDGHPRLTLNLDNGRTTEVTIGNSLLEDIRCPQKNPVEKDVHFKLFYKLLKDPGATEYIPVRIKPEMKCASSAVSGNRSKRGSDCLPAQWP